MSKYDPEEGIRYCPDWLGAKKTGCPKKNQRKMRITDHIQSSTKKRKRKIMFCTICNKFNHNTVDCYRNPNNVRQQQDEPEDDDEFESNGGGTNDGATGCV